MVGVPVRASSGGFFMLSCLLGSEMQACCSQASCLSLKSFHQCLEGARTRATGGLLCSACKSSNIEDTDATVPWPILYRHLNYEAVGLLVAYY